MLRIHMSSHNDNLHKGTAKRNLVGGVAGIESYGLVDGKYLPIHSLTEIEFRTTSGTGTANNPQHLNDNDINTAAEFDAIGHYVEVVFDDYAVITEFNIHGVFQNNIGLSKIQHLWGTTWVDNTIDIPLPLFVWAGWEKLTIPVITKKIRIVATKLNSLGRNYVHELKIRG